LKEVFGDSFWKFIFLELPAEIRNTVCGLLLVTPKNEPVYCFSNDPKHTKQSRDRFRISVQLLRTCRQICKKGSNIPNGQNTFEAVLRPEEDDSCQTIYSVTRADNDFHWPLLRHLDIIVQLSSKPRNLSGDSGIEWCPLSKMDKLEKLILTFVDEYSGPDGHPTQHYTLWRTFPLLIGIFLLIICNTRKACTVHWVPDDLHRRCSARRHGKIVGKRIVETFAKGLMSLQGTGITTMKGEDRYYRHEGEYEWTD